MIKRNIALILLILMLISTFTACDEFITDPSKSDTTTNEDTTAPPESNPPEDSSSEQVETVSLASIQRDAYKVYPEKTTLVNSKSNGVYNYFVYKLGEIDNVPFAYLDGEYLDGISSLTYNWETSQSGTNTHSFSEESMLSMTVTAETESKLTSSIGSSIGASFGGASANINTELKSELTASNSVESSVTESEKAEKSVQTQWESKFQKTLMIPKGAPAGYYRYAVTYTCAVYVVLECNIEAKTYTYDYITLQKDNTCITGLLYSDRAELKCDDSELLEFDTSVLEGMDLFGELPEIPITINLDFSDAFTYISNSNVYKTGYDYTKFADFYDENTGVFTLTGRKDNQTVEKYIIKGCYGLEDSFGNTVNSILDGLSFRIFSSHDITVEFEGFAFRSTEQYPAIYMDDRSGADITLTIYSNGAENRIEGGNQQDAISFKFNETLSLVGHAPLKVMGGNGSNNSTSPQNGGCGIRANTITVNMTETLKITGGNGGNAYDRPAGDNDGDGSDGRDGYVGGNGGCGIYTSSLFIRNGAVTIYGGDGGDGGNASEGNGAIKILGGDKQGGDGGDGGNGGYALACYNNTDNYRIELESGTCLYVYGGNGGDSGARGGIHDNERGSQGNMGTPGSGATALQNTASDDSDQTIASGAEFFVKDGSSGTQDTTVNED